MTKQSPHRKAMLAPARGWFMVGCFRPKTGVNVGTLWRSARWMGASGIFTIRERFPERARINMVRADPALGQQTDTAATHRHVPYLTFESVDALREAMPLACIVGVELDSRAVSLPAFNHPERAVYLLGAEDDGLPPDVREQCDHIVEIPGGNLNVAVAGSIVLYDRIAKAAPNATTTEET